jgi:hypothetical protein
MTINLPVEDLEQLLRSKMSFKENDFREIVNLVASIFH